MDDFDADESRGASSGVPAADLGLSDAMLVLEAVMRHAGDGVKLLDLDGRVLRWNSACEDFYGWRITEVLGTSLPHIPEELRTRALMDIRAVAASGRVVEREVDQQRADGSRVVTHVVLVPVHDADGHPSGVLSLVRGVGEDGRFERQREGFVAAVAGELRDPLATATGLAQLLQRGEIADNRERRDKAVSALTAALGATSKALDDLLLASRLEAGPVRIDASMTELSAMISEVVAGMGVSAQRLMIDFDASVDRVMVDRVRLSRSIECLIHSALARSAKGQSVGVSVYSSDGSVIIEIADAGPVRSQSEKSRLFERFYTPESATQDSPDLGVALFLAKAVVEAHGGALTVSDRAGVGSVFVLRLPKSLPEPTGGIE